MGPDIVQDMTEKIMVIRKRIKAAQSRQKAYADQYRRPFEFAIGDKVFLKVSPMRGVVQTGKKNKLDPRDVGTSKIWRGSDHWHIDWLYPQSWRNFTVYPMYLS